MLLLVTGTIILLLDLTYSPNKEHVFNKVSEYIIYKLNNIVDNIHSIDIR